MDKVIYGIDLGTTYSCLAYVNEEGKVEVVKDKTTGAPTVPSSVLKENGQTIVGRTAKNQSVTKADKYGSLFKRNMGEADKDNPEVPYKFALDGATYSPQALSAAVLTKLVNNANMVLRGHQVISSDNMKVVITYPAYFSNAQRNATKEAGEIAGLEVVSLIEEPLAAANYYVNTANITGPKNILVYDLGGGTFDITLVEYTAEGKLVRLCADGNARLGGADWDKKLIDFFIRQISEENGVAMDDLRNDLKFMQDLSNKAETLKIELTEMEESSITIMSRYIQNDMMEQNISITRQRFEDLTRPLLESTISLIDNMYTQHHSLNLPQPDEILLVGGSTKMPQVLARLREKYPSLHILSPDPDEAVAKGAAIYAAKLLEEQGEQQGETAGEKYYTLSEGGITQTASRSYGVRCLVNGERKISNVVVAHKSNISKIATGTFYTESDFQKSVKLVIYESTLSDELIGIDDEKNPPMVEGILYLSGNEPAGSPIVVHFDMSYGNMLKVRGVDNKTGKSIDLECRLDGSLTSEEICVERDKLLKEFQNK